MRRTEKHLSILDNEIDFIDTYEEDTSKYFLSLNLNIFTLSKTVIVKNSYS